MTEAAFLAAAEAVVTKTMSILTDCGGGTFFFAFPATNSKINVHGDASLAHVFMDETLLPDLARRYFAPRMRRLADPMPPPGCTVTIKLDTRGFFLTPVGKASAAAENKSWADRVPTLDKKLDALKMFGLPFLFRVEVGAARGREVLFPAMPALADVDAVLGCEWVRLVRENTKMPRRSAVRDAARAAAAAGPTQPRRRSGATTNDLPWRQRGLQAQERAQEVMQRNGGLAHYIRTVASTTKFFSPVLVQRGLDSSTFTVIMPNFKLSAAKETYFVAKDPVKVSVKGGDCKCGCEIYRGGDWCVHCEWVKDCGARSDVFGSAGELPDDFNTPVRVENKLTGKLFAVYVGGALVDKGASRYRCSLHPGQGGCAHIKAAYPHPENGEETDPVDAGGEDHTINASAAEEADPARRIPSLVFPLSRSSPELQRACADRVNFGPHVTAYLAGGPQLKLQPPMPQERRCACNAEYSPAGYSSVHHGEARCNVYFNAPYYSRKLELFELQCPTGNPTCTVPYTGVEDGLYRVNNNCVVTLDLLFASLEKFLHEGTSLTGIHDQLMRRYANSQFMGGPSEFLGKTAFVAAFYDFLNSLDACILAVCPCCKDSPELLVGDGTNITMPKAGFSGASIADESVSSIEIDQMHNRASRQFFSSDVLPTPQGRGLAMKLAAQVGAALHDLAPTLPPSPDWLATTIADALKQELIPFNSRGFLELVQREVPRLDNARRKAVEVFFTCIASESPVISYVTHRAAGALRAMLRPGQPRTLDADVMELLGEEAPVLAGLLDALRPEGTDAAVECEISPRLAPLLEMLAIKSDLCASGPNRPLSDPSVPASSVDTRDSLDTSIASSLPRLFPRYTYAADAKTSGGGSSGGAGCRHDSFAKGDRTGGIFTWFCRHGVCYAMYVIKTAEGRNEPFTFLSCYLKEAPKVVIYDFACALHEYCLNRLPGFFKNTLFLVDRLHWKNHKWCARSYNIWRFPHYDGVNSVVAEQNNAALRRIKASVTRMKQRSFMTLTSLFMRMWNERKIRIVNTNEANNAALRASGLRAAGGGGQAGDFVPMDVDFA